MTITPQDEEHLLIDMLIGTRNSVQRAKKEVEAASAVLRTMEKQLEDVEQAIIDYCEANGVLQFNAEHYSITVQSRESVDVPDVDAVPEEYTRIKREPNKILIKEARPQGNWYAIKETKHITLRSKS
jgi:hypothetical protein